MSDDDTYKIRDATGLVVFSTDDPATFVAEAEAHSFGGEGADSFEGGDPAVIAEHLVPAPPLVPPLESVVAERAAELADDPQALAEVVARLEIAGKIGRA